MHVTISGINYSTWTIKGSLHSVSSHFTISSPCAVNVHVPATSPKHLFSPSLPTLHCVRTACGMKMLLIFCTRHAVALNYGLNRLMEYIRQIIYIYIYIYENSTVQLASVGLAQAHPNNKKDQSEWRM